MPHRNAHQVLAGLVFLGLAAAPAAYADSNATTPAASQTNIEFSSDRVEGQQGGTNLVLSGNVEVRVPATVATDWSSDRVVHRADGALVLEGAVNVKAGASHISTQRAVVTHAANGDTLVSMDSAQVVRS